MPGRSRFSPDEKADIILLGLKDPKRMSELCRKHDIAPVTYSRWRRQFLAGGLEALQPGGTLSNQEQIKENQKLKQIVGSLYVELEYLKKRLGRGS